MPAVWIGVNYPWTVVDGKPNYGCDFGKNIWRSRAGVASHQDDVRDDFAQMAAMGVATARWFVLTDGRGGLEWAPDGRLVGLADGFFEDMDTALEIARNAGVGLCLVLFDYSWMLHREEHAPDGERLFVTRPELLATATGVAEIMATIVDPFLARYGRGGEQANLGAVIRMVDVINEPDWVTSELAPTRSRDEKTGERHLRRPFARAELARLVRAVADRVHAHLDALVTVGGGRVKFAAEWDDPAYGLDVIQLHSYPDVRHPDRDRTLIGLPAAALRVSKPVLIGEHPANSIRRHPPSHHPPDYSLQDYVCRARDHGYLGAWPWSFKGVDEFGAVSPAEMLSAVRALPPSS